MFENNSLCKLITKVLFLGSCFLLLSKSLSKFVRIINWMHDYNDYRLENSYSIMLLIKKYYLWKKNHCINFKKSIKTYLCSLCLEHKRHSFLLDSFLKMVISFRSTPCAIYHFFNEKNTQKTFIIGYFWKKFRSIGSDWGKMIYEGSSCV